MLPSITGRDPERVEHLPETFPIVRACQRVCVQFIDLREVSDGRDDLNAISGWTVLLSVLDARLAQALDLFPAGLKLT